MSEQKKVLLDEMVDRFLAWPLPESVCSDLCATDRNYPHPRSGTNLLTADEARKMLEHVVVPVLERDKIDKLVDGFLEHTQEHGLLSERALLDSATQAGQVTITSPSNEGRAVGLASAEPGAVEGCDYPNCGCRHDGPRGAFRCRSHSSAGAVEEPEAPYFKPSMLEEPPETGRVIIYKGQERSIWDQDKVMREYANDLRSCITELQSRLRDAEQRAANRDQDWILAMASALGTNSGFAVPIVPTPDAFKSLFHDILTAARERAKVHEHDCPRAWEFFNKHALGSKMRPSCLMCGHAKPREEWSITHGELSNIYICAECVSAREQAAQSAAECERVRKDAERWEAFCNLWAASTELEATQDEDGRWTIRQIEPAEEITFKPLTGDTPEDAIDQALASREGK